MVIGYEYQNKGYFHNGRIELLKKAHFKVYINTATSEYYNWNITDIWRHPWCCPPLFEAYAQPFGKLEVRLLNIRPPENTREICQQLPDPGNPQDSYRRLSQKAEQYSQYNLNWFSWSTAFENHTHNQNEQQHQKLSAILHNLTKTYLTFENASKHYQQMFENYQIKTLFTEAQFNIAQEGAYHKKEIPGQFWQAKQRALEADNARFTSKQ